MNEAPPQYIQHFDLRFFIDGKTFYQGVSNSESQISMCTLKFEIRNLKCNNVTAEKWEDDNKPTSQKTCLNPFASRLTGR